MPVSKGTERYEKFKINEEFDDFSLDSKLVFSVFNIAHRLPK